MKLVGLWTTDACGGLLLRLGYWHSDPAAAISTLKLTLGHIVILLVKPLLMKKLRKSTSASEPENVPPTPPRRSMAMAKQPRKFLALLNSQRIDPINEIFLVQRSHAGPHALIHCQVKAFTTNCNIVCEDPLCITAAEEYADRGVFSNQCDHTISTQCSQLFPTISAFDVKECLNSK